MSESVGLQMNNSFHQHGNTQRHAKYHSLEVIKYDVDFEQYKVVTLYFFSRDIDFYPFFCLLCVAAPHMQSDLQIFEYRGSLNL